MQNNDEGKAANVTSKIVSLNDFDSVDIEKPITTCKTVEYFKLGQSYCEASQAAIKGDNETEARVYQLLASMTQMHFKPRDGAEPYGPLWVFEGKRSLIPDDLSGEQNAILSALAPRIANPGLRARIADIAWQNNRSLIECGKLAVSSYTEALRDVVAGLRTLWPADIKAYSCNGNDLLRRACQVTKGMGRKHQDYEKTEKLSEDLMRLAFEECDGRGFYCSAALALEWGFGEVSELASRAECLAKRGEDAFLARDLWGLAAEAYHRAKQGTDTARCRIEAAECYVRLAEATGSKGMEAASHLMDAIKALREIGGTHERREELQAMLGEAQATIRDEMGAFSTEIDLSSQVLQTRQAISGLTLADALGQFAFFSKSPEPDALREKVLNEAREHPLMAHIPVSFHDDEGKVIAQSSGLFQDGEINEDAMRLKIAQQEDLRRQIVAQSVIEPARVLIFAEHPLTARHFEPLVRMSPLVPHGHEEIFALGFARFFGGDTITALHLLIPQLENSLRYILELQAKETSSILNDMTQENLTLPVILNKKRRDLDNILDPAIVLEIENLFVVRAGPNLRHRIAHGLVKSDSCHGHGALYACWFIFRLICLPLFHNWDQVRSFYKRL